MTNFGIVDLYRHGYRIDVEGFYIGEVKIPSDYVEQDFRAMLGEHRVISGSDLRDGMIVVTAETVYRDNPEKLLPGSEVEPNSWEIERANRTARWAVVTNLRQENRLVHFDAVYADGSVAPRTYADTIKWFSQEIIRSTAVCKKCGNTVFWHHDDNPDHSSDADLDAQTRLVANEMSFDDFEKEVLMRALNAIVSDYFDKRSLTDDDLDKLYDGLNRG